MEKIIKNPFPHQEVHWIDVYVCLKNDTEWITKDEFTVQDFADFDSFIISVEGNIRRYKYLHFYNYRTRVESEFSYYSSFYVTGIKSKEIVEKYTLHFQLVQNPKEMIGENQDDNKCSQRIILIDDCGERKIMDRTWYAIKYFIEYVKKLGGRRMKVGIYSRKAIEMLLKTGFPKSTAVISFYDPPGKFHDENYCSVDYKGKPARLFQVAVHDIDLSVLPEYGLNYNTYFTEASSLAEFIFEAYQDGLDIICQCEYGESRSSGCAAAILEYFYQEGLSVFADYRYYPNQVIYHKVFDALNEVERKKQHKEKDIITNENKFLIHSYYGIKENLSSKKMIFEAARRSYRDFWRRINFQGKATFSQKTEYERRSEYFLSEHLSMLFQVETQEMFDKKHHELCESLIRLYDDIGGIPYGVAQRLVNQTLIHLIVIESNLQTGYWNIADTRKFFHVPVELHTLQMATTKGRDYYQHILHLKCAPFKKGENDYYMDWFGADPSEVIPFERWNYREYIEYQTTLRKAIENSPYVDPVDWWFQAFVENNYSIFVGRKD